MTKFIKNLKKILSAIIHKILFEPKNEFHDGFSFSYEF